MNGFTDLIVGSTATDICDAPVYDLVGGFWVSIQQSGGGHDHTCLAVTALGYVHLGPRLLNVMAAVWGESFDGGDCLACDITHGDTAGAHGASVDVDGAGAALLYAAAVFGTMQFEVVAEYPE